MGLGAVISSGAFPAPWPAGVRDEDRHENGPRPLTGSPGARAPATICACGRDSGTAWAWGRVLVTETSPGCAHLEHSVWKLEAR